LPGLRTCGGGDATLQQGLEATVQALALQEPVRSGRLALALVDVTAWASPRLAMLNGDRMMYAASLPKIAILLGALAEAEAGRLPLGDTQRAAMANMIRHSDNADASRVLRWVGGERLLVLLQSPRFALYDPGGAGGLWVGKDYGPTAAYRRDPVARFRTGHRLRSRGCASRSAQAACSPPMNTLMLEVLSRPAAAPSSCWARPRDPVRVVWRKSGTWRDAHADSALVESAGRRFVMVGIAGQPCGRRVASGAGRALARFDRPLAATCRCRAMAWRP
jgi:beta-lactamase class A